MRVLETEVPSASGLDRGVVAAAFFKDAYRADLRNSGIDIVTLYAAVFTHTPLAFKLVLIARNAAARLFGLETPSVQEILRPRIHGRYGIGDRIGPWPIFSITSDEIVAGRDNPHMDFRVSVLRENGGAGDTLTVSTICTTHNLYGRLYMSLIEPFHRAGVRHLIDNAIRQGRL